MASALLPILRCVCAFLFTAQFGVSAAKLDCPLMFRNGSDNLITYTVSSAEIANANCIGSARVVFEFVPKGQTSSTSLCIHQYPPASCSPITASKTCGCTKQQGTTDVIYTYEYIFSVEDHHAGGGVQITHCVGRSIVDVSPNCNPIRFSGPVDASCKCAVLVIVLTVVAEFVFVIEIVVAVLYFILKVSLLCKLVSGQQRCLKIMFAIFAVMTAVVVILLVVALRFACKDFSEDAPCFIECAVVIGIVVFDVLVTVAIVIVIVTWKLLVECCCCYCVLDDQVLCLCCCTLEDQSDCCCLLVMEINPISLEVTSLRNGSSKESYTLTWTVSGKGKDSIKKFYIKYAKAEVDTSSSEWTLSQLTSDYDTVEADGGDHSVTISNLSANTYYKAEITMVKWKMESKGPDFIFKTAS